jgi:hypothetical protein
MFTRWLPVIPAQGQGPEPDGSLTEVRPLWIALAVAILLGALVIFLVDRWRKRAQADQFSAGDQLSRFRLLYEQGELSREEYDRIRSKLGARLRQELDVPARPAETAPSTQPPPESPPETPAAGSPPT